MRALPADARKLADERQGEPEQAAAARADLDALSYARLKEIVYPFCATADEHQAGQPATVPNDGYRYSYTTEETALLKPRCAERLPLLEATL